ISTIPRTARTAACSADSFSGTATSAPPPSPSMCFCTNSCAATTSSGGFNTSPALGAGTWARRSWTRGRTSLQDVRTALDADTASDRALLQRATTQELGDSQEAVIETVLRRLELSQKQAAEAYTLAEAHETNPRSVWGYVQGLTRLSQRTPWQDGRFALDRAASRLLTTVHWPWSPLSEYIPAWPSNTPTQHGRGLRPAPYLPRASAWLLAGGASVRESRQLFVDIARQL